MWREKTRKFNELAKGREHMLPSLLQSFGKDDDESSMNISDISSDIVNSQDDRPLTGSMFEPSQAYYCIEGCKTGEEESWLEGFR